MSKLRILSLQNIKNAFVFRSIIEGKLYLLVLFHKSKRSRNLEIKATRIIPVALYTSISYIIYTAMSIEYVHTNKYCLPTTRQSTKTILGTSCTSAQNSVLLDPWGER